jgi:hypothetical protein
VHALTLHTSGIEISQLVLVLVLVLLLVLLLLEKLLLLLRLHAPNLR